MKYFAGLDVSLEWTSVCVGDGEQERPQRRARDRTDGPGGHDPACAREDAVEPAQADAADQPQVHAEAAVRGGGQHPGARFATSD